jgi:predicted small metal-binding protein
MAKVLRCRDVGMMDCDFEARAETEEEILKKAAEHAQTVHNMEEIPEEVLAQVRAAIRDE